MVDARTETPLNTNILSERQFKFMVKKLPTVDFNIQNVNIPGISSNPVEIGNPLVTVPYHGDHITFEPLVATFILDEDLVSYREIWDWIRAYGYPNNWEEYSELTDPSLLPGEGLRSDINLVIMNSSRIPNIGILYKDAFPISLSGVNFTSIQNSETFVEATATFRYSAYEINTL